MLQIPKNPTGYPLSALYTVLADGQDVPVRRCRVSAYPLNQVWPGYQRPTYQTEEAAFAFFDFDGEVTLHIIPTRSFTSVAVRPASKGVVPTVANGVITFTLREAGPYTVELDGFHHALHLFTTAPKTYELDDTAICYGPGIHDVGLVELEDNQTVYIDANAVVYGGFHAADKKNIRILGRGVLDNSRLNRGEGATIAFDRCENITVSGPTCVDSSVWTLACYGGTHVWVDDVKLVGMWRYNSDGIDFCNCQDVELRDSFLRNYDDCIVIKGLQRCDIQPVDNIRISNCVVWCDWGNSLELGAETVADSFSNITFRNIDVIRGSTAVLDIQSGDRADIHDVTFEDIRVEYAPEGELATVLQSEPDQEYVNPKPGYLPPLMQSVIYSCFYSKDTTRGKTHDILFRNISVIAPSMPPSSFSGFDEDHMTKSVRIENLTLNGQPVKTLADANVTIGEFASEITIK